MLLFMCIHETKESPGHEDAAKILQETGIANHWIPFWNSGCSLQVTPRPHLSGKGLVPSDPTTFRWDCVTAWIHYTTKAGRYQSCCTVEYQTLS